MKTILLALLLTLQGMAISAERHVVFDSPGAEGSDWKWIPVTLTDAERELLSKRSDSPQTALDYYLLLSGKYFRNIASGTDRRITFIDRESLSDKYLHAEYTIPSIDAGRFWITIRLFGDEDDPLIAISHRSGTKRLFAAKQNGPQRLWTIALNRPEFWRYRGGAFSEGGAFVRAPDSVLPELSADRILERYRSHYKAQIEKPKAMYLSYALPPEGNAINLTWRDFIDAEYTYKGGKFEPTTRSEQDGADQPATAPELKPE